MSEYGDIIRTDVVDMDDVADLINGAWRGSSKGLATTGGSSTAYTVTIANFGSLAAGDQILILPHADNTAATTIAINGGTAKNVFHNGLACIGGEFKANVPALLVYDGTQWQLLNHAGGMKSHTGTPDGTSTMDWGSVTQNFKYKRQGGNCHFEVDASGTTSGSASYGLTLTMPSGVVPVVPGAVLPAAIYDATYSGSYIAGLAFIFSTTLEVRFYNNQNFGIGSGRGFRVTGRFAI